MKGKTARPARYIAPAHEGRRHAFARLHLHVRRYGWPRAGQGWLLPGPAVAQAAIKAATLIATQPSLRLARKAGAGMICGSHE